MFWLYFMCCTNRSSLLLRDSSQNRDSCILKKGPDEPVERTQHNTIRNSEAGSSQAHPHSSDIFLHPFSAYKYTGTRDVLHALLQLCY